MDMQNAFARMLLLALMAALGGCIETPPVADMRGAYTISGAPSATVPFVFDDNRMFVDVAFVEPDGRLHKTRAFVNMGAGAFELSNKLYRELNAGAHPVRMQIGGMTIAIAPSAVQPEDEANNISININPFHKRRSSAEMAKGPGGMMAEFSAPMIVEAVIPPALLAQPDTVLDYGARTLTLAAPGTVKPDGIPVPIRVDPKSGFVTFDVTIDGKTLAVVLDNGGSYSVFRADLVAAWIAAHPHWLRSEGPIGESNYLMTGDFDVGAEILKIPGPAIGPVKLDGLGVASPATSGMLGGMIGRVFWDMYSEKAGERVDGWIGGNVLKSFRITLDYHRHTSYWLQQAPPDMHDLDQVGITLVHLGSTTGVAGLSRKNGVDTVSGVLPGDVILAIDGKPTAAMTRGEVLNALHGTPGDRKHLSLKRNGQELEVYVPVTGF